MIDIASSVDTCWYSLQKILKIDPSGPGALPARNELSARIPR
jgi:hypothetical protein